MYGRNSMVVAAALLLGACATVSRGVTETFVVRTTPSGALASSPAGWECETPCQVKVARRGDFVVTLRKKGYVTKTVTVRAVRSAAPKGLGDRVGVPTGWIGTATDTVSGAHYEHRPNPLEVNLEAAQ